MSVQRRPNPTWDRPWAVSLLGQDGQEPSSLALLPASSSPSFPSSIPNIHPQSQVCVPCRICRTYACRRRHSLMIFRSRPLPYLPRASGTPLYARGETSSRCFTRRVETQPHFAMTTATTTTNLMELCASNLEPRDSRLEERKDRGAVWGEGSVLTQRTAPLTLALSSFGAGHL